MTTTATISEITLAADQLLLHARRYHRFQANPSEFLAELRRRDRAQLQAYLQWAEQFVTRTVDGVRQISPVVFLRRVLVTRILAGEEVTLDDLAEIQRRIEARDTQYFSTFPSYLDAIAAQRESTRSPFANWTPFRVLFYVDYYFHKDEVQGILKELAEQVQTRLELDDCDYHLAGFDYNNNFGTDRCWVALYPAALEDHKDAYQVFFDVGPEGVSCGLVAGSRLKDPTEPPRLLLPEPLNPDSLVENLRAGLPQFRALNRELSRSAQSHFSKPETSFPLNLILYGPPGTGKTYSVQRRAVEIIEGSIAERSGEEIAERFRRNLSDGRIEFVTFHPSYSYEEFVEGFRYDPEKQVPVLHDGTFKNLVNRAVDPRTHHGANEGARIWKVSLGGPGDEDIFDQCMKRNEIAIGWFPEIDLSAKGEDEIRRIFEERGVGGETNNIRTVNHLVNEIQEGDYVAVLKDHRTIRAIGTITGPYAYRGEYGKYPHVRPVEWLDQRDHDIYELNGSRYIGMPTIYPLNRISLQDFVELLPRRGESLPHVLIIDEINRGNIPRIFGELITLLEPDKRRGMPNELRVKLPYSQERFSVPPNVYVIGTMNTADRSIALLDVALRRRFTFEEMMPDVEVIRSVLSERIIAGADDDVDLTADQVELICEAFSVLNRRISVLLDRDHQIGHSEFLGIRSLADLHRVLYHKVFPLLQEYFYNDRERLERVLGKYEPAARKGFVAGLVNEYRDAFGGADTLGGEMPWELHRYRVGELEDALRNTFGSGR